MAAKLGVSKGKGRKCPGAFTFRNENADNNEGALDADVRKALEAYQCAINRYNNADLSDPKVENIHFLERQIAYVGLQLALAKARIREGMDPKLDYTSFESLLQFMEDKHLPNMVNLI